MDIKNLIKTSLLNYDLSRTTYKDLIDSKDIEIDLKNDKFSFSKLNQSFNYEILGIFDDQTKTWVWSWLIPTIIQENIQISRSLLDYGLNLTTENKTNDYLFLKTQLTNSRFRLENSNQLDLHLALCSYLSKDKIKFIYPYIIKLSGKQKIFIYYIIK